MKKKSTKIFRVLSTLALMFSITQTFSQTFNTWIGGVSGSFSATGSWSLAHTPLSTETILFDGNNIDGSNGTGNISVTAIVRTPIAGIKLTNNANVTFSTITAPSAITSSSVSRPMHTNTVTATGGSNPFSTSFSVGDLFETSTTGANIGLVTSVNASSVTTDEPYYFTVASNTLYRAQTLIISGTGGLSIATGCTLSINAAVNLSLLTGATGDVSGRINFTPTTNTAIRINVADDRALKFKTGSVFVLGNFAGGWPFGFNSTSFQGKVVFESGSSYYHASIAGAGIGATNQWATPFGGNSPASSVEFNDGSTFVFCNGSSIGLSTTNSYNAFFGLNFGSAARYFSNLQISANSTSFGGIGIANTTINFSNFPRVNNITVDASQALTWNQGNSSGWPILGNVTINGTIPCNATNAQGLRLLFAGTTPQTITNFNNTTNQWSVPSSLTVAKGANVTFANNFIVNPTGSVTSTIYGRLNMGTNTFTNWNTNNLGTTTSFPHSITIADATANITTTGIVNAGILLVSGLSSTTGIAVGMGVSGTGIPTGTVVTSIVNSVAIGTTNTVTSGSSVITANTLANGTSIGAGISGTGIPTGTTITALYGTAIITQACTNTSGSASITGIAGTTNPFASASGMSVSGAGVAANTYISSTGGSSGAWTLTLNQPTTGSVTSITATPTIIMSQFATANNNNVALTSTAGVNLSQVPTATNTSLSLTFSNDIGTLATSNTGGLPGSYVSTNASINQPSSTGNVEINGATTTPFPSAWTAAVTLNNFTSSADVTLNKNLTVNNALSVPAGTLTTAAAGTLTLGAAATGTFGPTSILNIAAGTNTFTTRPVTFQSTSAGTAAIATIAGTLNGATNVTVERYIPSSGRKSYTLVTSPVSNPTIYTSWQEGGVTTNTGYGTQITGATTGNGFDAVGASGFASIFTYNDANASGSKWVGLTNTNVNTLAPGAGYLLYVRGDRAEARYTTGNSSNTTLRATGTITTGNFTPVLTTTLTDKFNLVANPYASAITWTGLTRNNLYGSFYVYDPNLKVFVTSNGTTVSPSGSQQRKDTLQSGQAFFIQNFSTGTPSITFTESAKVGTGLTASANTVFSESPISSQLNVNVYNKSNELADGVVALFGNDYKAGLGKEDAAKMDNFNETFSLTRNNTKLSIEGRPMVTGNDTLFFAMSNFGKKEYVLQIDGSNFSEANATLVDNYTGTKTALDLAGITAYNFAVNGDAASTGNDRFIITFGSTATIAAGETTDNNLFVKVGPNPVSNQLIVNFKTATIETTIIKVINNLGQTVRTINAGKVNAGNITIPTASLSAGSYTVQLISGNKKIAAQKIVKD